MRVAYLGHRRIAIGPLRALHSKGHELAAVVTHHPEACPGEDLWLGEAAEVSRLAGCPLLQPKKLADSKAADELRRVETDLWVVVGFLEVLPPELLSIPQHGAINFHAALLPRYRGRAPITRAIMNGETKTGATVHFMSEELDAGDIICQQERRIHRHDTVATLYDWATREAPDLVVRAVQSIAEGRAERRAQDPEEALTYGELTLRDRLIRWDWPAERIYDQTRALVAPWPGAVTHYRGGELHVWKALPPDPAERGRGADSGRILALDPTRGALVQTGEGTLWITDVQTRSSRGSVPAGTFFRRPGVRLGLDVEGRLLRIEGQLATLERAVRDRQARYTAS